LDGSGQRRDASDPRSPANLAQQAAENAKVYLREINDRGSRMCTMSLNTSFFHFENKYRSAANNGD
jgi:hypothetical protein